MECLGTLIHHACISSEDQNFRLANLLLHTGPNRKIALQFLELPCNILHLTWLCGRLAIPCQATTTSRDLLIDKVSGI